MARKPGTEVVVIVDGIEVPAWGLRAGQTIAATEYDHGAQKLTVWIEGSARVPPSEEVAAAGPS